MKPKKSHSKISTRCKSCDKKSHLPAKTRDHSACNTLFFNALHFISLYATNFFNLITICTQLTHFLTNFHANCALIIYRLPGWVSSIDDLTTMDHPLAGGSFSRGENDHFKFK